MPDVLTQTEALRALAETWAEDSRKISAYFRDSEVATVLAKCSEDLRRVAGETRPEWVSLRAVRTRTSRSTSYLYDLAKELERRGDARRTSAGWEIRTEAALLIPARTPARSLETLPDLQAMAAALGREPGR